jgi:hypothetical protein
LFALLKKAFIKTKPNYALDLKSLTIKIKIWSLVFIFHQDSIIRSATGQAMK